MRLALLLALLCVSCTSLPIDPAALAGDEPELAHAAESLDAAVVLANEFLASDRRETLPPGELVWRDGALVFLHAEGETPMRIRLTTWGGLVERFGFEGQERKDGFVVGARGEGDPRVANSLFKTPLLEGWKPPPQIAELLLHELTHVHLKEGTIGTLRSLGYYAEAIFLFRYRNHSDERNAYATSEEFGRWYWSRENGVL